MQNSFWGTVGIPFQIKTIKARDISDAVEVAFKEDGYHFYGSRWFIDIKSCFRIFRFGKTVYIAKEAKEKKADLEISNSKRAFNLLNGKTIGTKTLGIVVPQKIKLVDQRCFLVSEYIGSDLNDNVYTNSTSQISLNVCLSIVKLLLTNGVAHRGLLPRNIVENGNVYYLFDWEDARFDTPSPKLFDHLWQTNFLLNWSYLYNFHEIKKGIRELTGTDTLEEPPLVRYENTFREITDNNKSESQLRDDIDRVVFGSELPLKEPAEGFYIRPNDMGHIVADIFPSELDVLHDILSYSFRKDNEAIFSYHLQLTTEILSSYFKTIIVDKHTLGKSIQFYTLIPILMMLDRNLPLKEYLAILTAQNLEDLVNKINEFEPEDSIVRMFLSRKTDKLKGFLDLAIKDHIKQVCHLDSDRNVNIESIINYVINLSTGN